MVFSHLKVVNSFTAIYSYYYELIHITMADGSALLWMNYVLLWPM